MIRDRHPEEVQVDLRVHDGGTTEWRTGFSGVALIDGAAVGPDMEVDPHLVAHLVSRDRPQDVILGSGVGVLQAGEVQHREALLGLLAQEVGLAEQ